MATLTSVFTVTIDVKHPVTFMSDSKTNINQALNSTYVGKCYMGKYITKIHSVDMVSPCHFNRTKMTGGFIDVRFTANIVTLGQWDIVNGVTIKHTTSMIVGTVTPHVENNEFVSPQIVVSFIASPITATLTENQVVPVRILTVKFQPLQSVITAVGTLLHCDRVAPVYKITGHLDVGNTKTLIPLLSLIVTEMKLRTDNMRTRKVDILFFERNLYSYVDRKNSTSVTESQTIPAWQDNDSPAWDGPAFQAPYDTPGNMVSALDLVKRAISGDTVPVSGLWVRPLSVYRSSPLVFQLEDSNVGANEISAPLAFAEFLTNILTFLKCTRELIETYNSNEMITTNIKLWKVMSSMQLPF